MTSRGWLVGIALACIAAVGAALVAQHVYGMEPCPWCILQRLVFVVIALVALVGAALAGVGRAAATVLGFVLALAGGAAALWQHFVAAASASCNLTFADRVVSALRLNRLLPDAFEARASCADAAVSVFGLPFEFWSLALFCLIALASVVALRAR